MSARKTGALEVECPKCNAAKREPCYQVNRRGFVAINSIARTSHAARVKAAANADKMRAVRAVLNTPGGSL